MKYICIAFLCLTLVCACTEKKNEKSTIMPVEADHGIGDGAPSLDSLLQDKNNSFISEEKSDSITKSHQRDSI